MSNISLAKQRSNDQPIHTAAVSDDERQLLASMPDLPEADLSKIPADDFLALYMEEAC
jgi:hypothetical protein